MKPKLHTMTYSNSDNESDIKSDLENYTCKSETSSHHDFYCDNCGLSIDDLYDIIICEGCNSTLCIKCEEYKRNKCKGCDTDMCSICAKTNCYKCLQSICKYCVQECEKCKRDMCEDCDPQMKCRKICHLCKQRAALFIQWRWRWIIIRPRYKICTTRLSKEFEELTF